MRYTYVDPPSGWLYGFPRVLDKPNNQSFEDWLLSKGYPAKLIDLAVKHSRYWDA